jgi:hypothetical protein
VKGERENREKYREGRKRGDRKNREMRKEY